MGPNNQIALLERALARERLARKEAEKLLEEKSSELYNSNLKLHDLNQNLNQEIEKRTRKIKELAFLTENNPEPVFIINSSGFARPSNKAGQTLVPTKLNPQLKSELRRIRSFALVALTNNKKQEFMVQHNQNHYSISLVPRTDLSIVIAYAKDITSQIQNLEKLKTAITEAENARMTEQYFIAQISHEIRTPLNGIIGMSNILAEKQRNSTIIKNLQDSAIYLNSLVGKVLDLSKLSSGNFELNKQEFSFLEFQSLIQSSFSNLLSEKDMSLTIELDKQLKSSYYGDYNSIVQISNNLISNAIKYGKNKVFLKLELQEENSDFDSIKIKVIDCGPGIAQEHHESIFERYQRLSNNSSEKGFGIGLHLSLQLAKVLGGQLYIESSNSSGSTFVFEFPLLHPINQQTNQINPQQHLHILDNTTCLIAEDNDINYQYLKYYLDKMGIASTRFKNGTDLLLAMEETTSEPNLVLLDYKMPGLNGIELCRIIRKRYPKLPIVLLTANAIPEQISEAKQAGIDSVIFKPFSPTQLQTELSSLLIQKRTKNIWHVLQELGGSIELAKEIFGNDHSYAEEMVKHIDVEFKNTLETLQQLTKNRKQKPLSSAIHQFITSLAMLTLTDLHQQGETIDAKLQYTNFSDWNLILTWLKELETIQTRLHTLLH